MKFYKNFKLNRKVKLIVIGICIAIMILCGQSIILR